MIETGVNLTLNDNASAAARRVADGFGEVATAADGINSALDPRVLDQYNQKLTEIGEAYSKLNRGISQQNRTQAQEMRHAQQVFAGMGSAVSRVGGGDPTGALAGLATTGIAKLGSKLSGPAGIALAATAATIVGGVAAAGRYENRIPGAEMVAGLEGQMGGTIAENTQALSAAMAYTTNAVKDFGKTYEEGTVAAQAFLKAGGMDFAGTSQAAAYSLARRADFNRLASFEGMAQRYGIQGSLGIVDALRESQGLGIGQFEEMMGGYQDIVTSRLGRGISGGGGDIARQLEFFGNAGVTWQGALGAQKVQGLNQTVAGAAGLQQQSDLFLYRAAAGITGGDMIETKMLMEQGLSGEMFQGLMGEFGRIGYGETESILQLSKMFGISTTDAKALYGLKGQGIAGTRFEGLGGLAVGEGASLATRVSAAKETLKQLDAEIFGESAFNVMGRATIVIAGGLDYLTGGTGAGITTMGGQSIESYRNLSEQYLGLRQSMGQRMDKGSPAFRAMIKAMDEAEASGVSQGDIYSAILNPYTKAIGGGMQQSLVDINESNIIVNLLEQIVKANEDTKDAVNSDTVLEDQTGRDQNLSIGGGL